MRGADTDDGTLIETRFWGMANTNGENTTDEENLDFYDAYGDIGRGTGRNSGMVFNAVETGLVFLDVSSNNSMTVDFDSCSTSWPYPDRQVRSYEVEVTSVTGNLPGQMDPTPETVRNSVNGVFDPFERRWFVVSLLSAEEYEIVHRHCSDAFSGLNFPVIYDVYDREGNALPGTSVGVNGWGDAALTIRPDTTGDCYIQIGDGTQGGVWVNGGPRGAFRFEINRVGN